MKYYYNVGDDLFDNFFQANKVAYQRNSFADFKLSREEISSLESVDLDAIKNEHLQDLYVKKLKYLRENFSKLRLLYGGGVDSQTILELADQNGIEFDHMVMEAISLVDDPYVNEEHLPGMNYGSQYKQFELVKPTLEGYKTFDDITWYEKFAGSNQLCFRPCWDGVYLKRMPEMLNVTGWEKPWIYVEEVEGQQNYYWVLFDSAYREHMGFDQCAFFQDGIVPEVAVKQAAVAKDFIQTHFPDFTGMWGGKMKNMSDHHRKMHYDAIGRQPALDYNVFTGWQGKNSPNWLNEKTKRAMNECIRLGYKDFVDKFWASTKHMKDNYSKIPYCLDVYNERDFSCMLRYAAVFKINDDHIKHVSDQEIDFKW